MITGRSSQVPEPTARPGGGTACGHPLDYKGVARRPGDVACYYADPQRAVDLLGWTAQRGIAEMCRDAWRPVSQAAPPLPVPWQRAGSVVNASRLAAGAVPTAP